MKKLLVAAAMAASLALASCAAQMQELKNAYSAITGAVVSPTAVIVTAESFDALESLATIYVGLPRCTGSNGPACSSYAAVNLIRPAVRSGRVARNNLKQFLRDHPGQLGPTGLYDALTAATKTLDGVVSQYNIRSIVQ